MVNFQRMGEPWYFTPLVKHGNGNTPMFFDDFPLPIAMFDDLGVCRTLVVSKREVKAMALPPDQP